MSLRLGEHGLVHTCNAGCIKPVGECARNDLGGKIGRNTQPRHIPRHRQARCGKLLNLALVHFCGLALELAYYL
jgi:hypothetical protein